MQTLKELARTIIVIMILVAGVSLVSAWTAPTQTPPGGNVAAPVNVGALSQVKTGALQVNGFRNIGNSIFDGSVGIGTVSPGVALDVNGSIRTRTGVFQLNDGTTTGGGLYFQKSVSGSGSSLEPTLFAESATGKIYFATGGSATTKMLIDQTGSVGIGTASPTQKLDIAGAIKIGNSTNNTEGSIRFTGTDFEGRVGGVWKSLTTGIASSSTCPTATHEIFTSPQSGEMCIPKDTWEGSGIASGVTAGNTWYSGTATAESRMNTSTGKREVRITNCNDNAGHSCTAGWSTDVASCKYVIFDVHQYGCIVNVVDRYKAQLHIGNLYGDLNLAPYASKMFGPGAIIAGANASYPIGSQFGPGTAYPKGSHLYGVVKASGFLNNLGGCTATAPGLCINSSQPSCVNGFRLMYRLDLFVRSDGSRTHYWDCVRN